ncbi:MAG: BrnA antitoxin family protein [Chloroflexota bacterium]
MKEEYDFSKGKRGAVNPAPIGKTRITIRLDEEVIDWFHQQVEAQGGGNYQTLINQALREYIFLQCEPLEQILRRVVREELQNYRT